MIVKKVKYNQILSQWKCIFPLLFLLFSQPLFAADPPRFLAKASAYLSNPLPASKWEGFYSGISTGFSNSGDVYNFRALSQGASNNGTNLGFRAGYDFQRENIIYGNGFELTTRNSSKNSITSDGVAVKASHFADLTAFSKLGYVLDPKYMVYGKVGLGTHFISVENSIAMQRRQTYGITYGFGAEYKLNENLSLGLEADYSKTLFTSFTEFNKDQFNARTYDVKFFLKYIY